MRDRIRTVALRLGVTGLCGAAVLLALPLVPGAGGAVPGVAQAQGAAETLRTLTVSGSGQVQVVPDMAMVRIGVSHRAPEAGAALQQTSDAVAAMLARLQGLGIAERDIQTAGLALHPVWRSQPDTQGQPVPDGFEASNMVSLRLRDLSSLGAVLDALVADGANRLDGVSFGLQEPEAAMDEARRLAVAEAQRKAALYAGAAGVTLGPLIRLTEAGGGMPRPVMMEMAAMRADAVPVAPGEMEIGASVEMVFGLE